MYFSFLIRYLIFDANESCESIIPFDKIVNMYVVSKKMYQKKILMFNSIFNLVL